MYFFPPSYIRDIFIHIAEYDSLIHLHSAKIRFIKILYVSW